MTDNFAINYDRYLLELGQPGLVRKVAGSIVDRTVEDIEQMDEGREFCIKGKNIRGIWDRTLISSGAEAMDDASDDTTTDCIDWGNYNHLRTKILTADSEEVLSEAWWGTEGTVHHSWLLGTKKYGGGDFESRRYLVDEGKTLVCESKWHPKKKRKNKENKTLVWHFVRDVGK